MRFYKDLFVLHLIFEIALRQESAVWNLIFAVVVRQGDAKSHNFFHLVTDSNTIVSLSQDEFCHIY